MKWLIEKDVFDDGMAERFMNALQNQSAKIIEYIPFDEDQVFKEFDCDEPIFVYGSINLIKRLQYQKKQGQLQAPMIDYCPWNMFRTSVIYNRFKGNTLTKEYMVATVGEVLSKLDYFFRQFSVNQHGHECSKIFCKSDEGDKRFNGSLYTKESLKEHIDNNLNCEYIIKDDLLVLARKVEIRTEYRVVVSGNTVVTGSPYLVNGNLIKNPTDELPKKVRQFVHDAVRQSRYFPASMYVVDVAERMKGDKSTLKIIETGSIHMCGLYGCNIQKIVNELIKINGE